MNEMLEQLKHYFKTTPRSIIEEEWNDLGKTYGDIGPKLDEFLLLINQKDTDDLNEMLITIETPNYYSEFFYTLVQNYHIN
jgi:hypothetical protein